MQNKATKALPILFSLLAFVLFSSAVFAQNTKIGVVNYNQLLVNLPEINKAEEELVSLENTWQARLEEEVTKFQAKLQQFRTMAEEGLMSPREIQERESELETDREAVIALQQTMEQQIRLKRSELLTPLMNTLDQAIEEIGLEQGYSYILDLSRGEVLYFQAYNNISKEVEARYKKLRNAEKE